MAVPLPLDEKLLGLKHLIQFEARKAYLGHLEKIFTSGGPNEYEGMKRLWKFVKNNRSDGIPTLKKG